MRMNISQYLVFMYTTGTDSQQFETSFSKIKSSKALSHAWDWFQKKSMEVQLNFSTGRNFEYRLSVHGNEESFTGIHIL